MTMARTALLEIICPEVENRQKASEQNRRSIHRGQPRVFTDFAGQESASLVPSQHGIRAKVNRITRMASHCLHPMIMLIVIYTVVNTDPAGIRTL
jgi:hypothetical protein